MYMNPISKSEFLGAMAIGWEGLDHVKDMFWKGGDGCEVTGVCAFTAIAHGLSAPFGAHYQLMDRIIRSGLAVGIIEGICMANNASKSKEEAMARVTDVVNREWPEGVTI